MAAYTPIGEVPLAHRAKKLATCALGAAVLFVSSGLLVQQHQSQYSPPLRSNSSSATSTLTKQENANFTGAVDQIIDFPGLPDSYTSRLFSGYLPIGNGGEAFYFFAESQSETPETDPVVLWLNGGPGASSLAGCFSENGPLIVNDDGETLRDNDYAWNKNANFMCIESPVGVGFSYNVSGLYESDDLKQAEELYAALQSFYGKFPWLRANDFIITGESYGGIYVPTTAKRIVEGNLEEGSAKINLKKFVVGNGVNEFGGLSMVLYAFYHGLISTTDYRKVRESCPDLKEFEPSVNVLGGDGLDFTSPCAAASLDVMTKLVAYHVNSYNIYGTCYGTTEEGLDALVKELLAPDSGFRHPLGSPMTPCLDSRNLDKYFNQPSVRTAMHTKAEIDRWYGSALPKDGIELIGKFIGLNDTALAQYKNHTLLDYKTTLGSVVTPLWKFLLAHNVSGVIYHGDADMVCDFIGGLWAVESMKLPRQQDRLIWTVPGVDGEEQTAGFLEDFGALKYVTVKGAGHLVPQVKPIEAKKMLDLFVLN